MSKCETAPHLCICINQLNFDTNSTMIMNLYYVFVIKHESFCTECPKLLLIFSSQIYEVLLLWQDVCFLQLHFGSTG